MILAHSPGEGTACPRRTSPLIKAIYDAFGVGDVPGVLGRISPDIVWNEAENFPYADRNPYVGPQAVAGGACSAAYWPIGRASRSRPDEILRRRRRGRDAWSLSGRLQGDGQAPAPQIVHVWRVEDGKATQFQQYADTLHIAA